MGCKWVFSALLGFRERLDNKFTLAYVYLIFTFLVPLTQCELSHLIYSAEFFHNSPQNNYLELRADFIYISYNLVNNSSLSSVVPTVPKGRV